MTSPAVRRPAESRDSRPVARPHRWCRRAATLLALAAIASPLAAATGRAAEGPEVRSDEPVPGFPGLQRIVLRAPNGWMQDSVPALTSETTTPPAGPAQILRPGPAPAAVTAWTPCAALPDTDDTTPVLNGNLLVVNVFVKDPSSNWDGPFASRSSAAMRNIDGTNFIHDRASGIVPLHFNQFSRTVNWFWIEYVWMQKNVTIAVNASGGMDAYKNDDWVQEAARQMAMDWGVTDADGDGNYTDDVAKSLHSVEFGDDPGPWHSVVLVFHVQKDGMSFAHKSTTGEGSYCIVFNTNYSLPIRPTTHAHELLHLFSTVDEYNVNLTVAGHGWQISPDGCASSGDCTKDYTNPWIDVPYGNGNCELCLTGIFDSCIMRLPSFLPPLAAVNFCPWTLQQLGWDDHDSNGYRDWEDAPAWASYLTPFPPERTRDATVLFRAIAVHGGRDIREFQYQVNSGSWTGSTPLDGAWDERREHFQLVPLLSEGTNTINIRARAALGSGGLGPWTPCPASRTVVRDTQAPAIANLRSSTHTADACSKTSSIKLSWDKASDPSGVLGYSWTFDQSAATSPDGVTEAPEGTTSRTETATGDGDWYFHIRVMDKLGNAGPVSHFHFVRDATPPDAPVVTSSTHPVPDTPVDRSDASFSWTPLSGGACGTVRYTWAFNQESTGEASNTDADLSSETNVTVSIPLLEDGAWYLHVRARDGTGNWGPTAIRKITVARRGPAAPVVSSVSHPDPSKWYSAADLQLGWTLNDATVTGYSYVFGTYGGQDAGQLDKGSGTVLPNGLFDDNPSGVYYFNIRAKNTNLVWGDQAQFRIQADVDPPTDLFNLKSPSHNLAIGHINCQQSPNNVVTVTWNTNDSQGGVYEPSTDGHSGLAGYSFLWDHAAATAPDSIVEVGVGINSAESAALANGTDWYFHVRAVDRAADIPNATGVSHIGPFYIDVSPPAEPAGFWATAGSGYVYLSWTANGEPDLAGYRLERGPSSSGPWSAIANPTALQTSTTDQDVQNGETYWYRLKAKDACQYSAAAGPRRADPEYVSAGLGTRFTLATLVDSSQGGVRWVSGSEYSMHGTVTIVAGDSLLIQGAKTLRSADSTGTKTLLVRGQLTARWAAGQGRPEFLPNSLSQPWGGIRLEYAGAASLAPASLIDSVYVSGATTGIEWVGGSPAIKRAVVLSGRGIGIHTVTPPGAPVTIDSSVVFFNAGSGIVALADSAGEVAIRGNHVVFNSGDGISYSLAGPLSAGSVLLSGNTCRANGGAGIACGRGGQNTLITANLTTENLHGIVLDSYGWNQNRPQILSNTVIRNRVSGIRAANGARPDVLANQIYLNVEHGIHAVNNAAPNVLGNTITQSRYGVRADSNATVALDANGAPGNNQLHDHSVFDLANYTATAIAATGNFWGRATTAEMNLKGVNGNISTLWDGRDDPQGGIVNFAGWQSPPNMAPVLAMSAPSQAGPVNDTLSFTWTATDPDAGDDPQLMFYYDTDWDARGGTAIPLASNLKMTDPPGLAWDVHQVPSGRYTIYGVADDGKDSTTSVSPSAVRIAHPEFHVRPDSLALALPPDSARTDTLWVSDRDSLALHFSIAETPAASWLAAGTDTGTVAPFDSVAVPVTWSTAGLAPGVYTTRLRIVSDDPDADTIHVGVRLLVAAANLALSEAAHDFGDLSPGDTSSFTLRVSNTGTADLRITSATLADSGFGFSGPSLPDTLPPGAEHTLAVWFAPRVPASYSGTLALATNDPDTATVNVSLTGRGLAPVAAVSDSALDFGFVPIGSMAERTVTVADRGNDSLDVLHAWTSTPVFVMAGPQLARRLVPGDSVALLLRFIPVAPDSSRDTLRIGTSDPERPEFLVVLTGRGGEPHLAASAATLDFDSAGVGEARQCSLQVRNTGTAPLSLLAAASSDSAWRVVAPALPAPIAAGDSVPMLIEFRPLAAGPDSATLWLGSDDPGSGPLPVGLRGTGLAPAACVSDTFDFGDVHVGAPATAGIVLLSCGTDSLEVRGLSLASGAAGMSLVSPPALPASVAAGETLVVSVRFDPESSAVWRDSLRILTDDPVDSVRTVALSGRGVQQRVALTTTRAEFGFVRIGASDGVAVGVLNVGTWPLAVSSLAGAAAPFSVSAPDLPDTLAPGAVLTLHATFSPASADSFGCTLAIRTDDPRDTLVQIALGGLGGNPALALSDSVLTRVVFEEDSLTDTTWTLANAGSGPALVALASDAPWLALPSDFSSVPPDSFAVPVLRFGAFGFGRGVYRDTLMLYSDVSGKDSVRVPITMRVPSARFGDHANGALALTVTDEAAVGFVDLTQSPVSEERYGGGLVFPRVGGANLLYHGGLWVGTDSAHVSDDTYDFDWRARPDGHLALTPGEPLASSATFDDSGRAASLGLVVRQTGTSYSASGRDGFVMLRYSIRNASAAALHGVYAAYYLDLDMPPNPLRNVGAADSTRALVYLSDSAGTYAPCAGVALLTPQRARALRMVENAIYVYPYVNVRDVDKYPLMSAPLYDLATPSTTDWSILASAGPFELAAGESLDVAFAVLAAVNVADLRAQADMARGIAVDVPLPQRPREIALAQSRPNPARGAATIAFALPERMAASLRVYDVQGRLVRELVKGELPAGVHSVAWDGRSTGGPIGPGVYFYQLHAGGRTLSRKLVLIR